MSVTKLSFNAGISGDVRELWIAEIENDLEAELENQIRQYPDDAYATRFVGEILMGVTNNITFFYAEFARWKSTGG